MTIRGETNIDKKSILGGLLIGVPIGGELQVALINRLYNVIGLGLPQDAAGWALAAVGTVSAISGIGVLLMKSKPVV